MPNGAKVKLTKSSGNIFADLGFGKEESIALLHKSRLMIDLIKHLRGLGRSQQDLGVLLDIGQSRVSDLMRGKVAAFSLEMLLNFAQRLGMSTRLETEFAPAKPAVVEARQPRVVLPSSTPSPWLSLPRRRQYASVATTESTVLVDAVKKESVASAAKTLSATSATAAVYSFYPSAASSAIDVGTTV